MKAFYKLRLVVFFTLGIMLVHIENIYSGIYYIDQVNGKDSNNGLSAKKAWASLEKVNQFTFKPGDRILFKAGTRYYGQLRPSGSGTAEAPIIIDRYGSGDDPSLSGEGKFIAALYLYNVEYWEINHLDISNKGSARQAGRRGVYIEAKDFGNCHHIYLKNLTIHDVNGSLVKKEGGGSAIAWRNYGEDVETCFIGLMIENCHLLRCERNGINSSGYTNRLSWHPSKEVVIRGNLLEDIPGDGIVPIGCDGALIEHNVIRNCPDILPFEEAAAGIWPWSSDNTIIQYNEVSGQNAKWDGQGFDSDWNCRNTLIQYNYSHDNAGGFLLICNPGGSIGRPGNIGTINTIVRYNVSVNDGIRNYPTRGGKWFSPTFHVSGPCSYSRIYNNLILMPPKSSDSIDARILVMGNWDGPWPSNTLFANNIFYVEGKSGFDFGGSGSNLFIHNVYFGKFDHLPFDLSPVFSNPLLVDPGARGDGFSVLKNFILKEGSPCINSGADISAGIPDIFGFSPGENYLPSIGISQKAGGVTHNPDSYKKTSGRLYQPIGKKGACITTKSDNWISRVDSLNVDWHYSWGEQLSPNEPAGIEFVPMIWSAGADTSLIEKKLENVDHLFRQGKVEYLLGFNEPDGKKQANMTVDQALAHWPRLERLGIPLGSPACVHPDNEWMRNFMRKADSLHYRVDFICMHWYGGPNAKSLMDYVQNIYRLYRKPIWITEFAVGDWNAKTIADNKYSKSEILSFMQEILHELNNCPYVEKYAWFPASESNPALGNSALFDKNGNLTALGKYYKNSK